MMELILKKCNKCGALIKVIKDCNCRDCGIKCCKENMVLLKANSVDVSFEKHVPIYEIKDNKIIVTVNHVMEEDHYIKWICLITENGEEYKYFNHNDSNRCEFNYVNKGILYSYCNKHGLWKCDIK